MPESLAKCFIFYFAGLFATFGQLEEYICNCRFLLNIFFCRFACNPRPTWAKVIIGQHSTLGNLSIQNGKTLARKIQNGDTQTKRKVNQTLKNISWKESKRRQTAGWIQLQTVMLTSMERKLVGITQTTTYLMMSTGALAIW